MSHFFLQNFKISPSNNFIPPSPLKNISFGYPIFSDLFLFVLFFLSFVNSFCTFSFFCHFLSGVFLSFLSFLFNMYFLLVLYFLFYLFNFLMFYIFFLLLPFLVSSLVHIPVLYYFFFLFVCFTYTHTSVFLSNRLKAHLPSLHILLHYLGSQNNLTNASKIKHVYHNVSPTALNLLYALDLIKLLSILSIEIRVCFYAGLQIVSV